MQLGSYLWLQLRKPGSAPQSCLLPCLRLPRLLGQEALWSGTVSFWGGSATILQVDSWPLWLLSCYQAMPSLTGSGKVPPGSLAAGWSGAMLLAPMQACTAAWVDSKCQTVPAVHSPKWQRERCNKKFLIFAPARLGVQSLQFVLVFCFFPLPDYCQVFHIDTAI